MTQYEKRINRAMKEAKEAYDHECIFSGHHEEAIVGAHIFKRSEFPERASWPENIVPLSPHNDALLEKIKSPWERMICIITEVHPCFKDQIVDQMTKLFILTMDGKHKKRVPA